MKYLSLDGLKKLYKGIIEIIDKKIKKSIDDIEIGGENLFNSSRLDNADSLFDFKRNFEIGHTNSVSTVEYTSDGIHFTSPLNEGYAVSNGISFSLHRSKSKLKTGDIVTFSADVKGSITGKGPSVFYWSSIPTDVSFWAKTVYGDPLDTVKTDEFTRYSITLTLKDLHSTNDRDYFCIAGGFGGDLTIRNIKLEKGNKPTSYSISVEDQKFLEYSGEMIMGEIDRFYPFQWVCNPSNSVIVTSFYNTNFTVSNLELYDQNYKYIDAWIFPSDATTRTLTPAKDWGTVSYVKLAGGTIQPIIIKNVGNQRSLRDLCFQTSDLLTNLRLLNDPLSTFSGKKSGTVGQWSYVASLKNYSSWNVTEVLVVVYGRLYRMRIRFSASQKGLSLTETYITSLDIGTIFQCPIAIKLDGDYVKFYINREWLICPPSMRIIDIYSESNLITLTSFDHGDQTEYESIENDVKVYNLNNNENDLAKRVEALESKLSS